MDLYSKSKYTLWLLMYTNTYGLYFKVQNPIVIYCRNKDNRKDEMGRGVVWRDGV